MSSWFDKISKDLITPSPEVMRSHFNVLKRGSRNKKAILVHGWTGGPNKNWFPWLGKELSKMGYSVLNMAMPNTNRPNKKEWLKHLVDHAEADKNTIIIAHSIGCMAVLKYLEVSDKIKAAILVAPFTENENKYKTISSFFDRKLNWKKINSNCKKLYTVHSDDDPFVSAEQRFPIQENSNAVSYVEKSCGHFDGEKIPKVLEIIKNELDK